MSEPSNFKIVIVWLLAGCAIYLGITWWNHEQVVQRQKTVVTSAGQSLEIERSRDGHYHIIALINGKQVPFLLDTGATSSALPASKAAQLGLVPFDKVTVNTANGVTQADVARAQFELPGLVRVDNLKVTLLPEMDGSGLLGMDVLGRLRMVQEGNRMMLSGSSANQP
jgi:aspartyl protease family protein